MWGRAWGDDFYASPPAFQSEQPPGVGGDHGNGALQRDVDLQAERRKGGAGTEVDRGVGPFRFKHNEYFWIFWRIEWFTVHVLLAILRDVSVRM